MPEKGFGFCKTGEKFKIAKVMLHKWEEPCISGENGSGAIFFGGCGLGCVYCQNSEISGGGKGKYVTDEEFKNIIRELEKKGAHNINLVTPTHYTHRLAEVLDGINVPVVYNCGGYEKISALKALEGKVNIYLADFKYALHTPAAKYSSAPDYPETAERAILEMYRQVGNFELDENGLMKKGLIVRYLVLPGQSELLIFLSEILKKSELCSALWDNIHPAGKRLPISVTPKSTVRSAPRFTKKSVIMPTFAA